MAHYETTRIYQALLVRLGFGAEDIWLEGRPWWKEARVPARSQKYTIKPIPEKQKALAGIIKVEWLQEVNLKFQGIS